MTAMLYLPTTLVTALKGFEFEGKNLWRLAEGLNHVRVELTFQLRRPDSQLTDPGRFDKGQQGRGERQPIQPQPPPHETALPTINTALAPTPATISFQRVELMKTPATTPISAVQRPPTPPVKAKKQTRCTAPILTSSPIAVQPEQMSTSPVDLNVATSDLPEMDELEADKQLTQAKLDKYKFRKLIKHYHTDYPQCRFIQAQRKRRRPDTANIDLVAYFVKFAGVPYCPTERPSHSNAQ